MKKEYRVNNLWGEALAVSPFNDNTDDIIAKATKEEKTKKKSDAKLLQNKTLSIEEKLIIIKNNVYERLGVYSDSTEVIYTRDRLHDFISLAVRNGIIAVDTETNKSLDPHTCKLMGVCLYTVGNKQVYVPINHVNPQTNIRLENQLCENDIKEELERISDITVLTHNGKFDKNVLLCTCGVSIPLTWDTMIGSQIIDENISASLKYQYSIRIDSSIGKYDIEEFFGELPYEVEDPDVFALYAATDAMMTYKLYVWQKKYFERPENEGIYRLFLNVEMPVFPVVAQMELDGVAVDAEYIKRLGVVEHNIFDELTEEIKIELSKYDDMIAKWRKTSKANKPEMDEEEEFYAKQQGRKPKRGKSLSEKLETPVKISSPTQLAILLYDVIGVAPVDKKSPRTTNKKALEKINLPLCKLLIRYSKIKKMLESFIDVYPKFINPVTGRIHGHFNQLGKEENNVVTGRFSSTEPNLQQVSSKGDGAIVRMCFTASCYNNEVESENNTYVVSYTDEVLLKSGEYKFAKDLVENDILDTDEAVDKIVAEKYGDVIIYVKEA